MSGLTVDIEPTTQAQPAPRWVWLHDPQRHYWVQSGGFDIFLQRRNPDGSPNGARHPLFRALAGQLVMGLAPSKLPVGWGVVAVKLPGTLIWTLTAQDFAQFLLQAETRAHANSLLSGWVTSTSHQVTQLSPRQHLRELSAGLRHHAQPGELLSTDQGVVWVLVGQGEALWMGQQEFVVNLSTGVCPVSPGGFLRVQGLSVLDAVSPLSMVEQGQLWRATQLHLGFVIRHALRCIDLDALAQCRASAAVFEAAGAQTRQTLTTLMDLAQGTVAGAVSPASRSPSVEAPAQSLPSAPEPEPGQTLQPAIPGPPPSVETASARTGSGHPTASPKAGEGRHAPLLQALAPIGELIGVTFRSPSGPDPTALSRNAVGAVCAASAVRYRRVALTGAWWKTDSGPLLASVGEQMAWVALLPVNDSSYALYDPASGDTRPCTAVQAQTLGKFGFSFYRPFPNTRVRRLDLLKFGFHQRWRDAKRLLGISLFIGLLGVVTPVAFGLLIDKVIPSADLPLLWQMLVALFITALATGMFHIAQSIALLRFETHMNNAVQSAVMDRVLKLPVSFFRNYSKGDLAERINGINTIRRTLSDSALQVVLGGIFSVFNFGVLFVYSPKLATMATLMLALALAFTVTVGLYKLRYERQLAHASGRLAGMTFQYLNGISKIRIASAEIRAFGHWVERFATAHRLGFQTQQLENIEKTFFAGYPQLLAATLFIGVGMTLNPPAANAMTTGGYIAFSAALASFFNGFMSLAHTGLTLLNIVPIYERAKPILDTVPESSIDKPDPGELQGAIAITGIDFRYKADTAVLQGISLSIRPGEYVALVGPSGCGKSTLLRLLLGFEKATAGTICYDGQDMLGVDIGALRRQFGVVLQSGKLMAGDIFTNIVGATNLGQQEAWEAARMVGLDDDIRKLPMGMFTLIGDGAGGFSGGQRQRIMIARAIVHRPRILFFDEATCALDNQTQAIVSHSLLQLKATRIVIAHRLSTVIHADRIIVLDAGRVVQDGTYSTLLNEPGLFNELAKRQIT